MLFEWDERKSRANKAKHGISFELASNIWLDPNHVLLEDRATYYEERWIVVGMVSSQTVLVAVHTYREDNQQEVVRIISARRATPHERKRYEAGNVA